MSLIRVRRERKKAWIDVKKRWTTRGLIFFLILIGAALWFLGTY